MAIKKIRVRNFKGFRDLNVELGKFNVLIGANAAGKSNFIQIFKFLLDVTKSGLDNAISMQGGIEYLRNMNIGSSNNFSVDVYADQEFGWFGRKTEKGLVGIKTYEVNYEFSMNFKKRGFGYEIIKDKLTQRCHFFELEEKKNRIEEGQQLGDGEIIFSRVNGKVEIDNIVPTNIVMKEDDIIPPFLLERELHPNTLLLETPVFFLPPLENIFSEISIYDFDPKLPKRATPITGKAELEEDGSNLAIVLKNILESKDNQRKLFNFINELLPFVNKLDVEKFADKSLLFKLQEKYFEKQYLPASLISDGTINITALIIALYFEKRPLIIIEEPERNIHPFLISKVVDMMKDASQHKQIIVTTHNPEIVKYAGLDNILLISRDREGFSTISRPNDKDEVKEFLKNEIGIEELYVQNLLEV